MKNYTLDDLAKQVKKDVKGQTDRLRNRYALARALGFTPPEAKILSFKSENTIKELAKKKNEIPENLRSNME